MAQKQNLIKIEVEIEYIDHLYDSEGNHVRVITFYSASINNDRYKMSVLGFSIAHCFKELSISMFAADENEKSKTK